MTPKVIIASGSRAIEERLLVDLEKLQAEGRKDPFLLKEPVLVVVSSGPLRKHLMAMIARRLGGAALGVEVKTLWGVAGDILASAGESRRASGLLFEVLVRREAAREKSLREPLDGFDDGYRVVGSTVRDLLSAGFEKGRLTTLEKSLSAHPEPKERARGRSLLRVAARTQTAMLEAGAIRSGDLLKNAALHLAGKGTSLLRARGVLIHGFSDATGQAVSFINAMLEHAGARIYLDEPADPASPETPDPGVSFVRRFAGRLHGAADAERTGPASPPPEVDLFNASGADGEVREVAYRIRELLDGGTRPESVGLVARNLTPYIVSIRRRFRDLGIPFSGSEAPAGLFPEQRRLKAAIEVLRMGGDACVDRWIEALSAGGSPSGGSFPHLSRPVFEDLGLALRALGAARIADAARLDIDRILGDGASYPLPVRHGIEALPATGENDSAGPAGSWSRRRRIQGSILRGAIAGAKEILRLHQKWPKETGLSDHAERARQFFADRLGWEREAGRQWRRILEEIISLAPGETILRFDEFVLLVAGQVDAQGFGTIGGAGAGVQVLTSALARGLTFRHLFLVGVNRGVFPRSIREDPILPDRVRRLLRTHLPDLPLKGAGFDEERYLFAEHLSSAPVVSVSWLRTDADGKGLNPSPLVERVRIGSPALKAVSIPRLREKVLSPPLAATGARPRTARDSLLFAALEEGRSGFHSVLPFALEESRNLFMPGDRKAPPDPAPLAEARARILDELDPDLNRPSGRERARLIGPVFGMVGPIGEEDPRATRLYVTALESMARCPWRTFLIRILGLEPVPDPLAALPGLNALAIGNTVHRALQRFLPAEVSQEESGLAAAMARGPVPIPRPDAAAIGRLVVEAAEEVAREDGVHLAGLHKVLGRIALPLVERAVALDWPEPETILSVIGTEVNGETKVTGRNGAPQTIHFKADRVDLADGALVLTDYKTGKPLSNAKRPETRARHLQRAILDGTWLQASTYAASAAASVSRGRYLFLDPNLDVEAAEVTIAHDEALVTQTFPGIAARLLASWDEGVFFPRLEDTKGKEPITCEYCNVSDACVRRDSGARRRLRETVLRAEEELAEGRQIPVEEELLVLLWFMGDEERRASKGKESGP